MDNTTTKLVAGTSSASPAPTDVANPSPGATPRSEEADVRVSPRGPSGYDDIPGYDLIGRGIRIRPRQPYELKASLFDREQRSTRIYHIPANDRTHVVPSGCEVNESPPLPANQSTGETLIEQSWDRLSNQLTLNVNAAVNAPILTIDPSALHASNLKTEDNSYYALCTAYVPLFRIYLPGVPDSLDAIDHESAALKKFDSKNRDKYNSIFDRFGTHYIKSVWVGGKASLVFTVSKSSNISEQEIRIAIQGSFGGVARGEISNDQKISTEKLKSNSSCRVFGNGGDRILLAQLSELDQNSYNKWLESIKISPQAIELGVAGIWTLIRDPMAAKALKLAYIEETTFVPLIAIVPISDGLISLDKYDYAFIYNPRPMHGQNKVNTSNNNPDKDDLIHFLPVLGEDPYDPFAHPDSAFSLIGLPGFGNQHDTAVELSRWGSCLRIVNGQVVDGYPKPIKSAWPGVDFDRVDAAVAVPPDRIYFFRTGEYIRVELSNDGQAHASKRDLIEAVARSGFRQAGHRCLLW